MSTNTTRERIPRTIDGEHPAEYAQRWGSPDEDGARFYNCLEYEHHTGRPMARTDWYTGEWDGFLAAIRRLRSRVADAIRTPEGRARTGWGTRDVQQLDALGRWAGFRYRVARDVPRVKAPKEDERGLFGAANSAGPVSDGFATLPAARIEARRCSAGGWLGECWAVLYV